MKMETVYFIGMVGFFCTTILYFSKYRSESKDNLILLEEKEASLTEQIKQQKRLKNYVLVSMRLNDISERSRTTKLLKATDPELQELLKELN